MTTTAVPRGRPRDRPGDQPAPLAPPGDRLLAAAAGSWGEHVARTGPVPWRGPGGSLVAEVAASGLTGRGGAGRPAGDKLARTAAAGRRAGLPVVVANGVEGEPASAKDAHLLTVAPHLVLDGVQLAAEAVGAGAAWVGARPGPGLDAVRAAAAERAAAGVDRLPVQVVATPDSFVAGQASALVSWIGGGPALPRTRRAPLEESGLGGAPTLVHNVETLAHLALVARRGAAWFRGAGTPAEAGTLLTTTTLADGRRRVAEVALGARLGELFTGAASALGAALLVGGYHGAWLRPAAPVGDLGAVRLSRAGLAAHGGVLGAGVVVELPPGACPLVATADVVAWLAASSARQCGPCRFGLPALAAHARALAAPGRAGPAPSPDDVAALAATAGLVTGRGACAHPDGTAGLVRSALTAFADDVAAHARGACLAAGAPARPRAVPGAGA